MESFLADELKARIQSAYESSGNKTGWRFLLSPANVLDGAKVAFVGLNPGGVEAPKNHAFFCMVKGSAYEVEQWGVHFAGESPLQKQILALFEKVGAKPENVLAGNLVPFRSRNWQSLCSRREAVAFGEQIWSEVFRQAKPELVIGMGSVANKSLVKVLNVKNLERTSVGWGRVTAQAGRFEGGRFVGLPHLSRFRIITRKNSSEVLNQLLGV